VCSENMLHASLVHSPHVLETKGHSNVAIHAKRSDYRSHKLVRLFHFNLVVAGICI
jgi:hypothetical protein